MTFKIRLVQSSHVADQFQLNGSLRLSAGLSKYLAHLKLLESLVRDN